MDVFPRKCWTGDRVFTILWCKMSWQRANLAHIALCSLVRLLSKPSTIGEVVGHKTTCMADEK